MLVFWFERLRDQDLFGITLNPKQALRNSPSKGALRVPSMAPDPELFKGPFKRNV